MPKSKSRKRKPPNRVLALRDLEHVKAAGLTSACGHGTHDHAIREFVALLFGLQLPFSTPRSCSDNIPSAPAQQRKP